MIRALPATERTGFGFGAFALECKQIMLYLLIIVSRVDIDARSERHVERDRRAGESATGKQTIGKRVTGNGYPRFDKNETFSESHGKRRYGPFVFHRRRTFRFLAGDGQRLYQF